MQTEDTLRLGAVSPEYAPSSGRVGVPSVPVAPLALRLVIVTDWFKLELTQGKWDMVVPLKIGVIHDWKRGERGMYWDVLLAELNHICPNMCETFRLADLIVEEPGGQKPGFFIQNLEVLIINWDAANGDPEFGAHLALRWLEHRRPEILLWIRNGGLLIIESQTVFSVPCQQAYDALAGAGELPVCGPEDPQDPDKQRERMYPNLDGKCRMTKHARKMQSFSGVGVNELLDVRQIARIPSPSRDVLFPGVAADLLSPHIKNIDWQRVLYRGWFRRTLPGIRIHPWVSLIETAGRSFGKNHSTLQVAKVGSGAIFASTMFLAHTGQIDLVAAMLGCARKKTDQVPSTPTIVEMLRRWWKILLVGLAGAAAGYLAGPSEALIHQFTTELSPWLPELSLWLLEIDQETLKRTIQFGLVPAVGVIVFEAGLFLGTRVVRWVSDFIGY